MKFHSLFVFPFILFAFGFGSCVATNAKKNLTFTPTNEWQKIEEGQTIPAGLHVRINLQTGYKEGKLPDKSSSTKSLVATSGNDNADNSVNTLNADELKTILKKIKSEEILHSDTTSKKFRSYEELKKDFNELNMQVKTDLEILTNLIENFKKFELARSKEIIFQNAIEDYDEEILSTLVDLEYLVHQFDNAREFAKQNGFSDVIYKSLNSTNSEIRSEALRLHGSSTQSNPKVQIAALESGSINLLLKILSFDEDINVRSRSLYAVSCMVRRFPAAQHKLINDGGLAVFASVFDEEKQDILKLQVKIITLIHDLLFERKDTKMNILEEESRNQTNSKLLELKERLRQYEKMDLEKKLVEQNWCSRISNWFIAQNLMSGLQNNRNKKEKLSPITDQHDMIEKVIDTLYVLSDICRSQFQSEKKLIELLFNLRSVYSELAFIEINSSSDDLNNFYSSISNILEILTSKLIVKIPAKEEL